MSYVETWAEWANRSESSKYSEAILAVKYREKGINGYKGGAMYYITNGLNMPKLGMAFAVLTILASFGTGNMTQSNAVATVLFDQAQIPTWITGAVITVIFAAASFGGIKRITKLSEVIVPVMVLIMLFCNTF